MHAGIPLSGRNSDVLFKLPFRGEGLNLLLLVSSQPRSHSPKTDDSSVAPHTTVFYKLSQNKISQLNGFNILCFLHHRTVRPLAPFVTKRQRATHLHKARVNSYCGPKPRALICHCVGAEACVSLKKTALICHPSQGARA